MDAFAVQVMPVAKLDEWRAFARSIESGERAEAHRQLLRRLGVKREHIHLQSTPAGNLMVLVWEGVEQDRLGELMGELQSPESDHERYLVEYVIPQIHGIDTSAGPPPPIEKVATIES